MLSTHRAERSDRLVDGLAAVLRTPTGDPFSPEVVAVPTRGVERWLTQRLSATLGASDGGHDGVCANVDFPFPATLTERALAAATAIDADRDPWTARRSVWPLLSVVDRHLGENWLAPLAGHLGRVTPDTADDPRRARRFAVVRHLADLFDHYGVHRPGMICAWAEGRDTDETGRTIVEDLRWQPPLWRALRAAVGIPCPAERLGPACALLRTNPEIIDLPPRLSLFGLTRLPATYLEVLAALAVGRDVHLWLLHPSSALWARVAGLYQPGASPVRAPIPERARSPRRASPAVLPTRSEGASGTPKNPLLASWARDAREMQVVLASVRTDHDEALVAIDAPATLLGRIQADIRADRPLPAPAPRGGAAPAQGGGAPRFGLGPDDRSMRVHACHGPTRQVEVLRDAILHLLSDDPTLEARDVIVLCPDIDTFAPIISATFGLGPGGDGHHGQDVGERDGEGTGGSDLRVRLADRSLRQTNPVLQAVTQLLTMVGSRVGASSVLDLAGMAPIRERFRLDDDDLTTLGEWVRHAGIRWGLDGAHRAPYHLENVEANTWRWGTDRVLAGVVMAADDGPPVDGTLPLDIAGTPDVSLVGRLAELVDRLAGALDRLSATQTIAEWVEAVATAADALMATPGADRWQRQQLDTLLTEVLDESHAAGAVTLSPAEVGELFADRLKGRPTRANFRTGHLTMCTLVPMRSVPHRVVCLLGLDDTVFPRGDRPDGDDLLSRRPRVGDSDPRSSDQQLLLDAVLAAQDHLVITYTGRDERTNEVRRPAIPVAELLDVAERTAFDPDGRTVTDCLVVHHPLQPFDARNFTVGALTPAQPWSFDRAELAGARAAAGPRHGPEPFLPGPLAPVETDLVNLNDLAAFVRHPVRAFLRGRLGISLPRPDDEADDGLPIDLDGLGQWGVGDHLLRRQLTGWTADDAEAAELAGGALPPGWLGQRRLASVAEIVAALVDEAGGPGIDGRLLGDEEAGDIVDVAVELPSGRTLVGTVSGLRGVVVNTVTFSRLKPTHRLETWVRLLALSAAHPEHPWSGRIVSRPEYGARMLAKRTALAPLSVDPGERRRLALAQLEVLIDLWGRGMSEPLPLYAATSASWAGGERDQAEPVAQRCWEGEFEREGERGDPEHRLVLGTRTDFRTLLGIEPGPDETGPGWDSTEQSRFGRLAHRLWDGLLAHEAST
ncbi:MAG: exodeoxyribonuclease V subunit gamma [Actinomycetota bacterium]|nr:exodeoxyribonuclease V subunit gamma [Actinomycetota bacterium]